MLHPAIEGQIASPPAAPVDGECWLIASGAAGVFAGREGEIACRQLGQWTFIAPRDGMRVFDRQTGQHILRNGDWRREVALQAPAGGATIDQEARAVIGQLLAALSRHGILPEN